MQRHKGQSPAKFTPETSEKSVDSLDACGDSDSGAVLKEGQPYEDDCFHRIFGFKMQDLTSWDRFVRLLCRPTDPASLGTLRAFFGFVMMLDVVQERGLAFADSWWGSDECRFPLFHFLRPLPLQWMYVMYLIMLSGAIGIMLGFRMRLSSVGFLATYWYVFFLNKTSWNNHSYLFGTLGFLFAISDANRYWSLDGLLNPNISNAHVPLWNYTLLRTQMFIVYFIAGLKKLDMDWVSGYSMQSLSRHWVFSPFRLLLTEAQIDLYIVHLSGLLIDLSMGFLLLFDKTRACGLVISASFHLMNSQLFSIGMFPYAMLVMQLVLCSTSWPRRFFQMIPPSLRLFTPEETEFRLSDNCVYPKVCVKSEETSNSRCQMADSEVAPPTSPRLKHKITSFFTILFVAWQFFLPYSHGITKGYNNWTNGLYGYSWDMMIHTWTVQHIRITYYDKDTGRSGYLNPDVWTGGNQRWSSHGDMIKQYALCIADNLQQYNITNVALYFDVWRSLNYRFQQRMIDPRVDMVTADWSPFRQPSWLMPLMVDLSDWRTKLEEIRSSLDSETPVDVVFVADFPGMYLENYVQPDYGNTSITVLAGEVILELVDLNTNITLGPEKSIQIAADSFHNVHTVSETPSCYMYIYVNTTEARFLQKYTQFEEDYNRTQSLNETLHKHQKDPNVAQYQQILESKQGNGEVLQTIWQAFTAFLKQKYKLLRRSLRLSTGAVYCLLTNNSFHEFLNATYQWEASMAVRK